MSTILVVDDKRNMLRLMAKVLREDGEVRTAETGAEALAELERGPIHVVLCDLKLPDVDGLEVLAATRRLAPKAEFILMTAYGTVGTAVEAMRAGAYDYLTKPLDPEAARAVVKAALAKAAVAAPESEEVLPGVLGRAKLMRELGALVRRLARSDATVLLLGDTGTGKERVARALHQLGPRAAGRFVPLNSAAIPAELLESELFGHAKGAFTGASVDKRGLFEEADGGTLFLDEIGDMRPSLQAKLTRTLEDRTIRRIGETHERPIDVRVIAATHRDLPAMVASGAFREDLWYRLAVAVVHLPKLRDREGDVELLARHFLAQRKAPGITGFTAEALAHLARHPFPGNVRELRSAVERAAVVAEGPLIGVGDLPPELHRPAEGGADLSGLTWAEALEAGRVEVGRRYLQAVLRRFDGSVAQAAAHAGVERESFYRLLRRHGVDPAEFRGRRAT